LYYLKLCFILNEVDTDSFECEAIFIRCVVDNIWERSIPFFRISKSDLSEIFHKYDANLRIYSYEEVGIGCRNSNYTIKTNNGYYFLRIFPPDNNGYLNEKAVCNILHNKINIPEMYFISEFENRGCLIYEYINSKTLQSKFLDNVRLENDIIRQVAKSAAIIHNFKGDEFIGLKKIDVPPFFEWYDLFLSNTRAAERIGHETVKKVQRFIADSESKLHEIDKYQSFIHGDFRPANMLIDNQNIVFIVDWEFPGNGHTLADIGQFFRYRGCFDNEHLLVFETEYNKHASVRLPHDWYELSRLRDLVNPLQMIGANDELPLKYQDLKSIILDTLEYFGY
jgi:thiamine kinase-like enzyme